MAERIQHPDETIEAAIKYAEELGWKYQPLASALHVWGRLLCPWHAKEEHYISIYTALRGSNVAQLILNVIYKCEQSGTE